MRLWTLSSCLSVAVLASIGCQGNQYAPPPAGYGPPMAAGQVQPGADWNARLDRLDADNRNLHSQLAQSQQQAQILRDQLVAVQKRLGETAEQLRVAQVAKRTAEQQYSTLHASTRRRGGAMITANSSLKQSLHGAKLNIPGATISQEGNTIRIRINSDTLFQPGTNVLKPNAYGSLDQVANLISQQYSRQRIGIEGHTDTVGGPPGSLHQLTSSQALTVMQHFTTRSRLPARQFSLSAVGDGRPLVSAEGNPSHNRRVEIVIYADTF